MKWKDYSFEYHFRVGTGTGDDDPIGLVFRFTNTSNYYIFWMCGIDHYSNCMNSRFDKFVNNVRTTLLSRDVKQHALYGWRKGVNYVLKVIVQGTKIQIFVDNNNLVDINDSSLSEGTFGPYSSSQDRTFFTNFKAVREVSEKGILKSSNFTGVFDTTYQQLAQVTVQSLLNTELTNWATQESFPLSALKIKDYTVEITNEDTMFEGMVSVDGKTPTPNDDKAHPYGRQKGGVLSYNVYRDGTKLTAAPVSQATYTDKYDVCKFTPGTKYKYEISTISPANQESDRSLPLELTLTNDKPSIKQPPEQKGFRDVQWTLDLQALVFDDAPISTLTLSTNSKYVTVTGTALKFLYPLNVSFTNEYVTVTVTDCHSEKATATFNVILVNRPPIITSEPVKTTPAKIMYQYKITATDPDGDNLSYKLIKAPPGAKIDATTGELTWITDEKNVGDHEFVVEVCDDAKPPECTQQTWKLNVYQGNQKPVISSQPPQTAYVGDGLVYGMTAQDPDTGDKHTWKIKQGPSGAQIDPATGQLTWTPDAKDADIEVNFEIEVCDDGTPRECDTQSFKLTPRQPCRIDNACKSDWICVPDAIQRWVCLPPGCAASSPSCANAANFCKDGLCISDRCLSATCAPDTACRPSDGKCVKPCAGVSCANDEYCADGECVKDPCASNGQSCPSGQICDHSSTSPQCIPDPCVQSACRHGRICDRGHCIDDPCGRMTCPDPTTQRCEAGQCVALRDCFVDIDCPNAEVCIGRKCRQPGCYQASEACSADQICRDSKCQANECPAPSGQACQGSQFCRPANNICVESCAPIKCADGERCVDGQCKADACHQVRCAGVEVCIEGKCESDHCANSNVCKAGRVCNPQSNGCTDDLCFGVQCPSADQTCRQGQCILRMCQFDRDCPGDQWCINQACIIPKCTQNQNCATGEICHAGKCIADPCANVTCPPSQFCKSGQCTDSCAGVFCDPKQICRAGKCQADPCADIQCGQDEICTNGKCVADLCKSQSDPCKGGRTCSVDSCRNDPCANISCPSGQQCKAGECIGDRACNFDADCPSNGVCIGQICREPGCYKSANCTQKQLCLEAKCLDNPCANGKSCEQDQICRPADGQCVPLCPYCSAGEHCIQGSCVPDPCASIKCEDGEICEDGKCLKTLCADQITPACRYQRTCSSKGCFDDLCAGMVCPTGSVCRKGQCQSTTPAAEPSVEPTIEPTTEPVEPPDASSPEIPTDLISSDMDSADHTEIKEISVSKDQTQAQDMVTSVGGGCSCNLTPSAPLSLLALMFIFFIALLPRPTKKLKD
jgi:hypothetical protein